MKRLRLRGDWSDTGPNARPDSAATGQAQAGSASENSSESRDPSSSSTAPASQQQQEASETENEESQDHTGESGESADTTADGGTADGDQPGQPRRRGPPVNMNLMQRMTDALSRMLNDPSTRLAMRTLSEREASR